MWEEATESETIQVNPRVSPILFLTYLIFIESKDVFLKKIQFCSQNFDFNDDNKMIAEKNERLKYISELSDLLTNQHHVINLVIPNLDRVMEMI